MTVAYLASVAFHAASGPERERRLRWDRCGIFVAVASYHTATILIASPAAAGLALVTAIWALAVRAVRRELAAGSRSPRNSVLPYLVLGWGGMLAWGAVANTLEPAGFAWLITSAAAVSLGVVAYRCERIPCNHELWHVLVMAGNACVLLSWVHGF
jgi:hemolysin III